MNLSRISNKVPHSGKVTRNPFDPLVGGRRSAADHRPARPQSNRLNLLLQFKTHKQRGKQISFLTRIHNESATSEWWCICSLLFSANVRVHREVSFPFMSPNSRSRFLAIYSALVQDSEVATSQVGDIRCHPWLSKVMDFESVSHCWEDHCNILQSNYRDDFVDSTISRGLGFARWYLVSLTEVEYRHTFYLYQHRTTSCYWRGSSVRSGHFWTKFWPQFVYRLYIGIWDNRRSNGSCFSIT